MLLLIEEGIYINSNVNCFIFLLSNFHVISSKLWPYQANYIKMISRFINDNMSM